MFVMQSKQYIIIVLRNCQTYTGSTAIAQENFVAFLCSGLEILKICGIFDEHVYTHPPTSAQGLAVLRSGVAGFLPLLISVTEGLSLGQNAVLLCIKHLCVWAPASAHAAHGLKTFQ